MKKYIAYILVLLISVGIFVLQFSYTKNMIPTTFYQVYLDNEKIGVIKSKEELMKYISSQGDLIKKQVSDYKIDVERLNSVENIINNKIKSNSSYYDLFTDIKYVQNIYDNLFKLVDENGIIKDDNSFYVKDLLNSLRASIVNGINVDDSQINGYDTLKDNINKFIKDRKNKIVDELYKNRNNLELTSSELSYFEDYYAEKLYDVDYTKYIYMKDYVEKNKIYTYSDNIYEPLGINIKKITTYKTDYDSIEDVYSKIIDKKPCTIEGYRFKIKKTNVENVSSNSIIGALALSDYTVINKSSTEDIIINVTDPKIFEKAIDEATIVFVGNDDYENYKNNKQEDIKSTGSKIDNIYLGEDITVKPTNISIKEKIFTDSASLSSYLLYGDNKVSKTVLASSKDTISSLAYKNSISVEEFFLSNPSFTSIDNMFYDEQPITITKLSPKISIVVEESQVIDKSIDYKRIEKYDETMIKGTEKIEQEGSNGLMRVSQTVKMVNGSINSINLISNETIKPAKNKIVVVGTKEIPNVGRTDSWGWPTDSGYTISSYFGWRADPFNPSSRYNHEGIDIAGTGYGSPIYATNNGTVESIKVTAWDYGKSVMINHNNGYWSNYGHLSGFAPGLKVGDTVSRGQIIGYMGRSGAATGTHLHFEIRAHSNRYASVVDPIPFLRK